MRSRRKNSNRVIGAAAILLGLMLFFYGIGRLHGHYQAENADSFSVEGIRTIILDPGHGGADGGAVGVNGTAEKDINLAIALKLRDMLVLQGYEVLMTREEDVMTCDPGLSGITKQKKSDMRNRLALMDEHPEAVVLCIHQNQFEQAKYHGAQMFYGKNHPWSKELAQCLQDAFVELLQPENQRQIKEGGKDLFLLWKGENPVVLVECGFLSNPEECEKLCEDEYQNQVAFTILAGLLSAQPGIEDSAA